MDGNAGCRQQRLQDGDGGHHRLQKIASKGEGRANTQGCSLPNRLLVIITTVDWCQQWRHSHSQNAILLAQKYKEAIYVRTNICSVWVWSFVIALLDSNVALDTRDSRLIRGSLGFLCCFSHYFASRHAVCLHYYTVSRCISWLDPRNMQVHANVPEVSQEYICTASKLRDRPRVLSSATGCGPAEHLA